MSEPIPTPEIDRMRAVKDQSQAIGEFLEWLASDKGAELAVRHKHSDYCQGEKESFAGPKYRGLVCGLSAGDLLPFSYQTEKLLAEFFSIDLRKVDDEKRALLDQLRAAQ